MQTLTDPKERDETIRSIAVSTLGGRWDMSGKGDFQFDTKSVNRIVEASLPAMREQYDKSFAAQNALNAQANTQSNVTIG